MHGNVTVKSFSGFQVNEALLARIVEAIKKGEADARRYAQIRSFEIYYDGYRQRMVFGRIMVIPAKIADSPEDFPAALLYGAMIKEIHPELQADLYSYRLGESEFDEYDRRGLQVIKDKLFKDADGKYRSIVLFLPTWANVRDYVVLKYNHDAEIMRQMVRQQIYGAYFNPALSSAFDHLSNDTESMNVSEITPKENFPGMSGQLTSFPELHAGDGDDSLNKTASAAKPRMLFAADTVNEINEEFLEPGERAVIDSLAEDLKGKIDQKTPAEAAKQAKLAAIENLALLLRTAFEKVQKFQLDGEFDQSLLRNALDLLMSIQPTLEDQAQQKGVASAIKHLDEYMIYEGGGDENLARAYTDLEDLCASLQPKAASTDDTGAVTGLRNRPDYNEADSHINEANAKAMKGAAKKAGLEWGVTQGPEGATWKVWNKGLMGSKVVGTGICPDRETAEIELKNFLDAHQNHDRVPMGALASKQAANELKGLEATEGFHPEPDWFDLNDYVLFNHPEVYAATKYLPQHEQTKLWGDLYAKAREGASKQAARGAEQQTYNGWRNAVKKVCPTATFEGDKDICSAYDKAGKKDIGEWDGAVGKIYSKEAAAPRTRTVVACEGATLVRTGNTFTLKAASGHTEPLRINASKVKWARPLQFTLAFRSAVAAFVRNPASEVNKTADVNLTFDSIWSDISEEMGPAPMVEVEGAPKPTINPAPGPGKTESAPQPEKSMPAEAAPKKDSEPKIEDNRSEDKSKERTTGTEEDKAEDKKDEKAFAKKETSRKRAAFDMWIPGQVLESFYPELQREQVESPSESFGGDMPGFGPGGLHGGNPSGVTESADGLPPAGEPYISTDPVAAMGIGNNGKPHILEGAPLSTELDIRGYGFDQEFYAHGGGGIDAKAFTAKLALYPIKKNASVEEWKAQFADFLKKAMGEVAATFIGAFKVTNRPLMNRVPGTGEIKLDEMEHSAMFPTSTGQLNVSSRVAYLMSKLTDSQIKEAINGAWSSAAVWNEDSNGGYTYEVFVRPESIDKENMVLRYEFVVGTKGL